MSPIQCPPLPSDTALAAESVFGREHPYLKIGISLERVWGASELSTLGSPGTYLSASFYPYSLITVLQYWEFLTDRQMSQATRTRLDIKYALHLPLNYPGVDPSTLCEFRRQVLTDGTTHAALQGIVPLLNSVVEQEKNVVTIDKMVESLCLLNRAETILGCMEIALEAVASQDPDWLKAHALPHWYRRYTRKSVHEKIPRTPGEIEVLIQSIGNDGQYLLKNIESSPAASLRKLNEIKNLENEWQCQFAMEGGLVKFRESHCRTCSSELSIIKNSLARKEDKGPHPIQAVS